MLKVYLAINALMYAVFAIWCTLAPQKTAAAVGFDFRSGSGRSEFVTVYGGLELGLALFFALAALRGEIQVAGLLFALCLYGAIVPFRAFALVSVPGIERTTYFIAALELVLLIAAVALWYLRKSGPNS